MKHTYIALLRGINVGGNKKVAMADLRDLLVRLRFGEPQSLLQSGNLVFRSDARKADELEKLLEKELEKRFGLQSDVFVRNAGEWPSVMAANPFHEEAERDPGHLIVMFLRDAPDAKSQDALRAAIIGRETFAVTGRHAYFVYPDGMGTSRLTGAVIEKKFQTRVTARNWNTVVKLGELVGADDAAAPQSRRR
ncbi:MAG: DUF1697 domain-containing protein [Thermoanaerobaculia bacterium]